MNLRLFSLVLFLSVFAGLSACQHPQSPPPVISDQETFTKQVQIPDAAQIVEINHRLGGVVVIGWEKPFILLEGTKHVIADTSSGARDASQSIDLQVRAQAPNRLVIEHQAMGRAGRKSVEERSVDLVLHVPRAMALDMDVRHGDVTVTNMQSPVSIDHREGDVEVESIEDKLQIRSENGDVAVRTVAGPFKLDSRIGKVRIEGIEGEVAIQHQDGNVRATNLRGKAIFNCYKSNLYIESVEGRLEIDNRRGDVECRDFAEGLDVYILHGTLKAEPGHVMTNSYYCRVVDGDAILRIPAESSALFELEAENGRIHSDYHVSVWAEGKVSVAKGAIHDGLNMVSCQVVKGSISILRSLTEFSREETAKDTPTLSPKQDSGLTPARVGQ